MFLNTFRNASCTTSSASSRFLVILMATFNRRRPKCFTRSSNEAAVVALRASTRGASGSAENPKSGMRSNSPGVHGALVSSSVCCSIISLHGAQMCNARTKLGCQEKIWRLHGLELAKPSNSNRLRRQSFVSAFIVSQLACRGACQSATQVMTHGQKTDDRIPLGRSRSRGLRAWQHYCCSLYRKRNHESSTQVIHRPGPYIAFASERIGSPDSVGMVYRNCQRPGTGPTRNFSRKLIHTCQACSGI